MSTALFAQGGGPTPVLNATLASAIMEAQRGQTFTRILGSVHGLQGILKDRFLDLSALDADLLNRIRAAPGAALGSSRDKLAPVDIGRVLDQFRRRDIRYFFYIGGNGSMGTAMDIEIAARQSGYELQVIGIPKTVDNDLFGTDHTPGYGSAARFYAHAVRDMGMDHLALPSPILICEVMGRNVGWLVGATAFARSRPDDAPHLIYYPENPLPREKLLSDIEATYKRLGRVFVCICEGQLDEHGDPFGADVDRPENKQQRVAANLGYAVSQFVSKELKLRARAEKLSLLGRSCSFLVSESDRADAELVGREAVAAAKRSLTGQMAGLEREEGAAYRCSVTFTALSAVARRERTLPREFMADPCTVTPAFMDYAKPLIGEILPHARLDLNAVLPKFKTL